MDPDRASSPIFEFAAISRSVPVVRFPEALSSVPRAVAIGDIVGHEADVTTKLTLGTVVSAVSSAMRPVRRLMDRLLVIHPLMNRQYLNGYVPVWCRPGAARSVGARARCVRIAAGRHRTGTQSFRVDTPPW